MIISINNDHIVAMSLFTQYRIQWLFKILLATLLPVGAIADNNQIVLDPVKEKIFSAPFLLSVKPVIKIPAREGNQRIRINSLASAHDQTNDLYINDMDGWLYRYEGKAQAVQVVLDMVAQRGQYFFVGGEHTGLIDVAFHPDFEISGAAGYRKLYTLHTEKPVRSSKSRRFISPSGSTHHDDVLAEWEIDVATGRVIPASFREIMRISQPHRDRNAASISFNHELEPGHADYGLLYIGVGDGGSGDHKVAARYRQGQNPGTIFGKILRIDPVNPSAGLPYAIPADNPFINTVDHRPEIWAKGFRRPVSINWVNQCLLIQDQGHQTVQEINSVKSGGNYGWPETQGTHRVSQNSPFELLLNNNASAVSGSIYPVYQYDQNEGLAISGGSRFVNAVTGSNYLFTDQVSGRIFLARVSNDCTHIDSVVEAGLILNSKAGRFSRLVEAPYRSELFIGQGGAGTVFLLTQQTGQIWKITGAQVAGVGLSGWVAYQDNFKRGSSAEFLGPNQAFQPLQIKLAKSRDEPKKNQYSYSGVVAPVAPQFRWKALKQGAGLKIQYRSTGAFNILLQQAGVVAGQEHRVRVAKSASTQTVVIAWGDFVQPDWVKNKVPLGLETIRSMLIQLDGKKAQSAEITLNSVLPF